MAKERELTIFFDQTNEQIVLASMLMNPDIRKRLAFELSVEDFFTPKLKRVFSVLQKMAEDKLEYNEDTFYTTAIAMKFNDTDYGGTELIRDIETKYVPNNQNIEYHVQQLKEDSVRAHILDRDMTDLQDMFATGHDIKQIASKLSKIQNELLSKVSSDLVITSKQAVKDWYYDLKDRCNRRFYGTGLDELDDYLTEGLAPKKLSTWAGFSGAGKTTLLSNLVVRLVKRADMRILFCVLETDRLTALDSFACQECEMLAENIIKDFKKLSKERKTEIYQSVVKLLSNQKLDFVDMPNFSIGDLRVVLSKDHYDLVIIDLFEKLKEVRRDLDQKNISQWLDVIQDMAKEYNTHIAITAQLRRQDTRNIKGKAKRPLLEYLKNTGKYAEASDLVIGLYRPKVFSPNIVEDTIEIKILKQRRGIPNLIFRYGFNGPKLTVGNFIAMGEGGEDENSEPKPNFSAGENEF